MCKSRRITAAPTRRLRQRLGFDLTVYGHHWPLNFAPGAWVCFPSRNAGLEQEPQDRGQRVQPRPRLARGEGDRGQPLERQMVACGRRVERAGPFE